MLKDLKGAWLVIIGLLLTAGLLLSFAPGARTDRAVLETEEPLPATVALPPMPPLPIVEIVAPATIVVEYVSAPSSVPPPPLVVRLEPPPTTTTLPPPPPQWITFDCDSFKYLFDRHNLPWSFFKPVVYRESHCDPRAYCDRYAPCRSTTDRSYGLGQINMIGSLSAYRMDLCNLNQESDLFNPEVNVACIAKLYAIAGTSPWKT